MNLKNLMMWGLIVLLVVGLFQLFQNPNKPMVAEETPFSENKKNIEDFSSKINKENCKINGEKS